MVEVCIWGRAADEEASELGRWFPYAKLQAVRSFGDLASCASWIQSRLRNLIVWQGSEGTLIALVRYGKLAFDIGGAVDHVDKDIDMKIFVRSQEDFLQKYLCISSSLQKLKWTCTAPSYIVEDAGEPWFFECSLARTDGGVETFGSAVELHVGRFFVAGDSIRMARNCTAQFCKQYSRELGSVKDLWMPPIKCRAYDTAPLKEQKGCRSFWGLCTS